MKRIVLVFALCLLSISLVQGATLYGALYDAEFNQIKNIQLEINTTPKQNTLVKDGAYFFNVPLGMFEVSIEKFYQKQLVYNATRIIEISKDGEFQIDIILEDYPFNFEEEDYGPSLFTLFKVKYPLLFYSLPALLTLLLVAAWYFSWRFRKKKKSQFTISVDHDGTTMPKDVGNVTTFFSDLIHPKEDIVYDLNGVLQIIKDEGGRTTQKDIRRRIPLSEAKVSLMIAELEAKGKVEKIKKGRGNIIVLK